MTTAQIDTLCYLVRTGYVRSVVSNQGENRNCITVHFAAGYVAPGAYGRMTRTITPSGKVLTDKGEPGL
jgi:hypothetical protein